MAVTVDDQTIRSGSLMGHKTLQTALLANAVFSLGSGVLFIGFGGLLTKVIGIGIPLVYQIIGASLLAFAGFVAWTATRRRINPFIAMLISMADLLWVIGTGILIVFAFELLKPLGMLILLGIAAVVLFFGLRQLHGIGRMYAVAGKPDTHKLCVTVDTPESAEAMWRIIADLATIKAYSPNLTSVILRDNAQPGPGAVRQCTDVRGNTWSEQCRHYDHETRRLAVQFLADEPGFPYPFKTMDGGWEVLPRSGGSTVTIWFEVTPKYRLLHPIILAVTAQNLAGSFGSVVARMAAAARGEAVPPDAAPPQRGITSSVLPCL
jgi:hypothetical protein